MTAQRSQMSCAACVVGLALVAGCFSATVHLADAPATQRSPVVDDSFHLNLLDLVEISDPVDLRAACGGREPVAIEEGLTALGGVVNYVLSTYVPVLSVMNASVDCAAP